MKLFQFIYQFLTINRLLPIVLIYLYGIIQARPLFISLGNSCHPAIIMRSNGLREAAFPFDWLITDFEGIYKAFETDFSHYFLKENLIVHPGNNHRILDTVYNFDYVHDFPTEKLVNRPTDKNDVFYIEDKVVNNFLDFHQNVLEKYQRRIDRLRVALNSDRTIIFVRHIGTKDQAQRLSDLLSKKFKKLNFIIAFIDSTEEIKEAWHIPHVQNFYVSKESLWTGAGQWPAIFRTLIKSVEQD